MHAKLTAELEKEVVQQLAPWAGGGGGNVINVNSKYTLLDAMVGVVRKVWSKTLMRRWSSNVITKDEDACVVWNMLWPKLFQNADVRPKLGEDASTGDVQAASGSRPSHLEHPRAAAKGMAPLSTVQDHNLPEEDRVHAMIA